MRLTITLRLGSSSTSFSAARARKASRTGGRDTPNFSLIASSRALSWRQFTDFDQPAQQRNGVLVPPALARLVRPNSVGEGGVFR
jgi:hypothetical protein